MKIDTLAFLFAMIKYIGVHLFYKIRTVLALMGTGIILFICAFITLFSTKIGKSFLSKHFKQK